SERGSDGSMSTTRADHVFQFSGALRRQIDALCEGTWHPFSCACWRCPAWSARSDFELTVCAMDVTLVNEVHAELNKRCDAELRYRRNFEDAPAQQLMQLLFADSADGYPADRLYTDHLIGALVCRFLVIGREDDPPNTAKQVSPLPRHILRRVIERMRNSDSKLSLHVLAKESGYSRVHFLRMFRAATGYAPHNYLLKLRVDRVRELLASSTLSLTEIALEC